MFDYIELTMDRVPIRIYADKMYVGTHTITHEKLTEFSSIQEQLKQHKIEFEWDTILEEDCSWNALFVRIDGSRWIMTQPNFNSEEPLEVLKKIAEKPEHWKTI